MYSSNVMGQRGFQHVLRSSTWPKNKFSQRFLDFSSFLLPEGRYDSGGKDPMSGNHNVLLGIRIGEFIYCNRATQFRKQ